MDISPPVSTTNWFANPIANTETNCINASLDALMWKFSYFGLNTALESEDKLGTSVESS